MAQGAPLGGLSSTEEGRSSMERFGTMEELPIDGEWRNLVDGGEERRWDDGWRGAQ